MQRSNQATRKNGKKVVANDPTWGSGTVLLVGEADLATARGEAQ